MLCADGPVLLPALRRSISEGSVPNVSASPKLKRSNTDGMVLQSGQNVGAALHGFTKADDDTHSFFSSDSKSLVDGDFDWMSVPDDETDEKNSEMDAEVEPKNQPKFHSGAATCQEVNDPLQCMICLEQFDGNDLLRKKKFRQGQRVRIAQYERKPELNGCVATVIDAPRQRCWSETRCVLQLQDSREVKIKPDYLHSWEQDDLLFGCGHADCSATLCIACLQRYFTDTVESTRYTVRSMRCPSPLCRRRIPMEKWMPYVQPEHRALYIQGAQDLLNLRCADCDTTGTLLTDAVSSEERTAKLKVLYSKAKGLGGVETIDALKRKWARYADGIGNADEVLDALLSMMQMGISDLVVKQPDVLNSILELIPDVERRCTLHLECLRRCPKIVTPCCHSDFCWKCKISGHHEGLTCEEVQRAEIEVECQFCPGCGVATQKTEGCDHIVCLCGMDWTWDGKDLGLARYVTRPEDEF
eukprot:gnl/MRDRNA2_/MRDRNA2_94048_c0_seq1.p1 gnl/MRDRNA2_/MRDRNA2_94048_c0~~gnl/MRDRNA2_/MRDRNA2_94048_c0_seq1.p1  ORF type:complete len:472 (-),score=96.31 gnl/MRDRNA2_/MRDRNA2_94048_c0_seq1:231-1646(-)